MSMLVETSFETQGAKVIIESFVDDYGIKTLRDIKVIKGSKVSTGVYNGYFFCEAGEKLFRPNLEDRNRFDLEIKAGFGGEDINQNKGEYLLVDWISRKIQ